MEIDENQQQLLKVLPGVDHILEIAGSDPYFDNIPKSVLVSAVRTAINELRNSILDKDKDLLKDDICDSVIVDQVKKISKGAVAPNLIRAINATGVVVHTNLGRSLLADTAVENLISIAKRYSNLEYDLNQGKRGSRYSIVENILCELSGADAAMVLNNNAGAVYICLDTIVRGKEVIVSRGELVEIGGSFRIPDVMKKSGAVLKEVGTTNRTHKKDYKNAIGDNTGLLLKVHTSNYSVVGFTADVSLKELVLLGKKYNILVMEDLGSGSFIDFSKYGLLKEPTIQESIAAGADIVTFSGDKLLGGPQAGIILGRKDIIDKIKQNPMARALRIDKLTLAALESTLCLYRDPQKALDAIPTLRMLTTPVFEIEERADNLCRLLDELDEKSITYEIFDLNSRAGGGALPLLELPSKCIGIKIDGLSANRIERNMRKNRPPVIGRIEDNIFILDLRTVLDDELWIIRKALKNIIENER